MDKTLQFTILLLGGTYWDTVKEIVEKPLKEFAGLMMLLPVWGQIGFIGFIISGVAIAMLLAITRINRRGDPRHTKHPPADP